MPVATISARYLDQAALETYLGRVFGHGEATVKVFSADNLATNCLIDAVQWARGQFHCIIPRDLTEAEKAELKKTVDYEHYYP
ncbi:hypothetical protein M011DRAFT_485674 [Sporormia fimetaria CBS 119925]|uniref:Uncharacterized protein n=1 Tax=Sporormia fimetaria CBS 119925 TaxID=1340428 RepID=A0A6A6VCS9_9PLEO|nr:hypothetical protein M011DRAFT_485674 [Sporormia fimetaria CBS 119925]